VIEAAGHYRFHAADTAILNLEKLGDDIVVRMAQANNV
jgi:hypothetical protein